MATTGFDTTVRVPAAGTLPPEGPRRRTRALLHAAWIGALALAAGLRVGRFGFHPSDQGFILAQSWRVLHGEIPHTDIISARPLGSAVLHVLDFAIPAPLFVSSSVLAMAEISIGTVALAVLVTRKPLLTWGPGLTALVAAAALLNLNSFPLMAWHTIDGIALTAVGAWALDSGLRSGSPLARRAGLVLLGMAPLVKQSFAPAAVLGLAWLAMHPSTRRPVRWPRLLVDLCCLAACGAVYAGVVTLDGGFATMVDQLTGGLPAYAERLLTFWDGASIRFVWPVLAVGLAVLGVALARRGGDRFRVLHGVFLLAGAAVVARVVVRGGFSAELRWADLLWWAALAAVLLAGVVLHRPPWPALLVPALGLMISLSWGQDTPTLLAGSLALTVVVVLADGMPAVPWRRRVRLVAASALGLAAVVAAGAFVVVKHDERAYLDVSHDRLTEDLGTLTPAMAGVRTNPSTYAYLAQIGDCVRRFPAAEVAVLANNPFAYPAFGLRNPFPLEWPLPLEIIADAPQRMLDTAERLNTRGDYLVLFQTVDPDVLAKAGPVPATVPPDAPIIDYLGVVTGIRDALHGQPVTCGSFVGRWEPRR
ncbi:hypothetical protein [Amycolatopsis sp. CA-230715]|uniref:hypothetical protein n=1 Tax=Amycolatopsis sp. CA-230715 TaxID=2745196 RepID=UPI001C33D306|nr:hypothetical protein [Amycolatopsis sp. CA-230715]QWF83920.1 hypothetical protein HUW46_07363 [Amycolatopsis sp. CA-230715]